MKIVFVSQPLSTGGAERVVAVLANRFHELGNEVKIIVVENGDKNIYYTHPEIEFIHIAKPSNPIVDLLYRAREMRKFFNEYHPDIIIPFTTQKNVSTLLATLFSNHKVIACERNNPISDPTNKILRILRKMLFWTAEGFVFQTEEAKHFFSKRIQERSCVIPNPIKDDLIQPWTGLREKKIIMASRLNPQKNIEMAVDAMQEISIEHPDYRLEIWGKSYFGFYDYENALKQRVIDKKLENCVSFMGFSSNVHEEMKDASIFLITSNHEGMSNSLMEALALGLPCVSTDDSNGGARALIKDHVNGILIPVGDTKACSNALNELICNVDLRQRLSVNAMKLRDELSVKRIADQWLAYMKQVLEA
jgi:glycosyltransferase involved in cell wall biosynthesis